MIKNRRVYKFKAMSRPAVYLEASTVDELAAALSANGEAADRAAAMATTLWGEAGSSYKSDRFTVRHEGTFQFVPTSKRETLPVSWAPLTTGTELVKQTPGAEHITERNPVSSANPQPLIEGLFDQPGSCES